MSTIKEATDRLRQRLEDAAKHAEVVAAECRSLLAKLPENPSTLPNIEAMDILRRAGFAAVHRDRLDDAITCVQVAVRQDHETGEEGRRLERLLDYLMERRRFAD